MDRAKQAILMRRMALMADRHARRKATEEENKAFRVDAISTMVYVAVLNGFLFDLTSAMKKQMPHMRNERHIVSRIMEDANYAHSKIYEVFSKNIPNFGVYYNNEYDKATEAINATVYLEGVERYYNIVLALLRIVRHHNDRCGRWHSPAVRDLDKAERRLKSLNIPCDDKSIVIETIIRNAVTIHFPNDENN